VQERPPAYIKRNSSSSTEIAGLQYFFNAADQVMAALAVVSMLHLRTVALQV